MYIYVQYTYVTDDTSMYIYVILRTCGNTCESLYVCQLVWVQATLSNNNHTTYTYIYSTAPFGSGSQHGYLDPSQEQFFVFWRLLWGPLSSAERHYQYRTALPVILAQTVY